MYVDGLSLLRYPTICDILSDKLPLNDEEENLDKEIAYRELFNRFAKLGETLDDDWIEKFDDIIIEEGEVVATHFWESDNPGAGAGMTLIYSFRGLFFTSDDFVINGPYEGFSEAAEAVGLLAVTETTERIWVDYKVNPDSGTDGGDDLQRRLAN
jgi:hypothetical protein